MRKKKDVEGSQIMWESSWDPENEEEEGAFFFIARSRDSRNQPKTRRRYYKPTAGLAGYAVEPV